MKKKNKNNLIIVVIGVAAILLLFLNTDLKSQTQTVVSGCYSDEYCVDSAPPKAGHILTQAKCIYGKCELEYKQIPEDCENNFDDDADGKTDCDDSECALTRYCLPSCNKVSIASCEIAKCWCPSGYRPVWIQSESNNYCKCG